MAVALKVCGPSGAIWAPVFTANNAPRIVCDIASEFTVAPIPDPALGIAGGSGRAVRAALVSASGPAILVVAVAAGGVAGGVVGGFAIAVGVAAVVVRTAAAGMAVACV